MGYVDPFGNSLEDIDVDVLARLRVDLGVSD
jgi:hypothetical protein